MTNGFTFRIATTDEELKNVYHFCYEYYFTAGADEKHLNYEKKNTKMNLIMKKQLLFAVPISTTY